MSRSDLSNDNRKYVSRRHVGDFALDWLATQVKVIRLYAARTVLGLTILLLGALPGVSSAGAQPSSVIGASGTQLTLHGSVYRFTGVNAYELATDYGVNAGCGPQLTPAQLDAFFGSLRPNSLVRIGAPQGSVAINVSTHQLDWGPLDAVFAAAAAHGQRLIVSLASQGAVCDGLHWQDIAWYSGGFMDVFNDPSDSNGAGLDPLSYWDYVQDVVNRYKDSPALGMWEPMSEGGPSTCPTQFQPANCMGHAVCTDEASSAQALRHFFDVVGGEIHSLDPTHLVESGLLGSGQCGTDDGDYQYVSASPGIDVLSYHDYYDASSVIGGDQWNGMGVRLSQATALNKPIIGGEAGILAGPGPGCITEQQRASDMQAKIEGQLAAGSSGVLVWNWMPTTQSACSMDIVASDPTMAILNSASL